MASLGHNELTVYSIIACYVWNTHLVINVSRGSSADYNNWSLNFSVCCPLWICVFLQVTSNFASLCPVLNNISFSDAQETYCPLHLGSVNSGLFFMMTLLYERVFHITRPLWGESIDQKVSSAETISMAWRFENSEVVSTKLTHVTMLQWTVVCISLFCIVHCVIWDKRILGFVRLVYCSMWTTVELNLDSPRLFILQNV